MLYPGSQKGRIYDYHVEGEFAGAMLPEDNGLNPNDALPLTGQPALSQFIMAGSCMNPRQTHQSRPDESYFTKLWLQMRFC